jgi:CheY-like chemotaxis protein
VLVDLGMPGVTGLVVSRVIKDHDPGAYVVLMTGSDSGLDAGQLRAAAVDRVMVKPPTREELLTVVRA